VQKALWEGAVKLTCTFSAHAAICFSTLGVLAPKGAVSSEPQRYGYLVQPWLVWSNVTMDVLIAASYVVIVVCLFWVLGKLRRLPEIQSFLWVFIAFGVFIGACASTRVMDVVTLRWPLYWLSVSLNVVCAASSVTTAILFTKGVPEVTRGVHQLLLKLATTQQAYESGEVEREQAQAHFQNSQACRALQAEELQHSREQLEIANRELEAFSYSVSHDLRTPLRHIAGFTRILANDFGAEMSGEAPEHLQRIEDGAHRMGQLLDALLNMAVLRRRPLKVSHTELNPLIAEVITVLAPECEGREVEWRISELPALECDPILMSQVFQNLLSNALKYSSGRKPAVIEVDTIQQPGKPVIVLVRDNGAGFDMRYAGKLFGMFQRLHTESEFSGIGVGLATVHRIIQKHGGSIWAESKPDHGATFYFSLQLAEADDVTKTARAFPVTWPNGLPKTLLK
jgi:signal transduction histidine kinase